MRGHFWKQRQKQIHNLIIKPFNSILRAENSKQQNNHCSHFFGGFFVLKIWMQALTSAACVGAPSKWNLSYKSSLWNGHQPVWNCAAGNCWAPHFQILLHQMNDFRGWHDSAGVESPYPHFCCQLSALQIAHEQHKEFRGCNWLAQLYAWTEVACSVW